jgi:hypothetical protein
MLGARLVSIGLGFGVMGHWVFTISSGVSYVNEKSFLVTDRYLRVQCDHYGCQIWLVLFAAWFVLARDNSKCFAPSNLQRAFLLPQVALALIHTRASRNHSSLIADNNSLTAPHSQRTISTSASQTT